MLYFSKLRIIFISLICIFFILTSLNNLLGADKRFFNSKINLGLDLQGGSYLLLEIDNNPVIEQKLQNFSVLIRSYFKDKNIRVANINIKDQKIIFTVDDNDKQNLINEFQDKESEINPYYSRFKSHQFEVNDLGNSIELSFSKQGIVELKTSSQDQALEIVRRRIDEVGTNEPNILKRGNDRILVELPGLDDPMRIKSLLGKTANLTFRFVSNDNQDSFGVEKLKYENNTNEDFVSKRIILSGENLLDAQPRMNNQTNETVVSFTLDRVGAKRFGKATSSNIGRQLAIVLDGKIISAPVIRDTIASGNGQISGGFTFQTATDLALLLRSGALPAPLNIIEERTVGPDLGQDSINAGMIALMIGFLLVVIYIFFKYKIFGLITNITLIINLLILLGILTLFGATLTLPGIAGIILTVGMAVDANVLIFERIKEELKTEKNNIIAFDSGYTKSRTAILDANITTLLAAIILFFMGSGPIKGFSVTLGVGIFDGVELLGDRSAIGWGSFWKINSSNTSHQLGSTADVHYNPEAPWKSTLRTGLEFNLAFFFSLVMVVLGLLFTFLPIHAARKKKQRLAETGDASEPGRKLVGGLLMAFGGIGVTFGLILGLVMTIVLKDDVGQANQARTWIPVEAKVITSGFVQMEEQGEKTWSGRIEYQYELNDRIYTSSRYALGVGRDLKPNGEAVHGYRPGDLATVHVNPMAPEDAVFTLTPLEESWGMFWIFMLAPACMLLCGLLFALTGLFTFLRG